MELLMNPEEVIDETMNWLATGSQPINKFNVGGLVWICLP